MSEHTNTYDVDPDKEGLYLVATGVFRPATTAEIREAHPVCSVCNFIIHVSNEHVGDCWKCDNTKSSCFYRRIEDPTTFYCRHWEAKP